MKKCANNCCPILNQNNKHSNIGANGLNAIAIINIDYCIKHTTISIRIIPLKINTVVASGCICLQNDACPSMAAIR